MSSYRGSGTLPMVLKFISVPSRWRSNWSLLLKEYCQPFLSCTFLKSFSNLSHQTGISLYHGVFFVFFVFNPKESIVFSRLCFLGLTISLSSTPMLSAYASEPKRALAALSVSSPPTQASAQPAIKASSSGATLFITTAFPPHFFKSRTKICGFTQMVVVVDEGR